MFKKEKERPKSSSSTTPSKSGDHTIVGSSAQIKGDLVCSGDLRVDGLIEGNVTTTNRIVIGKTGNIKGNIQCKSGEVQGKHTGDIQCKGLLALRPGCFVEGSLSVGQLTMEDGANLNSTSVITAKKVNA